MRRIIIGIIMRFINIKQKMTYEMFCRCIDKCIACDMNETFFKLLKEYPEFGIRLEKEFDEQLEQYRRSYGIKHFVLTKEQEKELDEKVYARINELEKNKKFKYN